MTFDGILRTCFLSIIFCVWILRDARVSSSVALQFRWRRQQSFNPHFFNHCHATRKTFFDKLSWKVSSIPVMEISIYCMLACGPITRWAVSESRLRMGQHKSRGCTLHFSVFILAAGWVQKLRGNLSIMSDKAGTLAEKTATELEPTSAPGTPPEHGRDYKSNADDALQLIESGGLGPIDPERSRRLLRRIDLYVMPLICT